jgi:hypothetical protein
MAMSLWVSHPPAQVRYSPKRALAANQPVARAAEIAFINALTELS